MRLISTLEAINLINKYNFKKIHVHHTWKPNHSNFNGNNHIVLNENMKRYHINNNGWNNIGQHLTLFPDGKWVTGRPLHRTPASIRGHNTGALCIEMLGNFDRGYDKLEGKQKSAMMELVNNFGNRYGFQNIMFHNEASSKSCPGTSINKSKFVSDAKSFKKEGGKALGKVKDGFIRVSTNGKLQDVPGVVINSTSYIYIGTTLTPLREACEALGLKVGWDSKNETVILT